MSDPAKKRILKDIRDISKNPLTNLGIYHYSNDDNIFEFKAMIVGPEETPYEGGFYFFDIEFPRNYPLQPPKIVFQTRSGSVRFNPNLYANGFVCLSMVNTWSGPSWTPCNTISSVLISLLGFVFIQHPLQNEPGHEEDPPEVMAPYNAIVEYENFRVATVMMLEKVANNYPKGFQPFLESMEQQFLRHQSSYLKRAESFINRDGIGVTEPFYNMSVVPNYGQIVTKMKQLIEKLTPKYPGIVHELIEQAHVLPVEPPSLDMTVLNKALYSISLKELQELAKKVSVPIVKTSSKTGKTVRRTKSELKDELTSKKSEYKKIEV